MIASILNALQLLLIVVTPFVLFTLAIHRIERFTQHRLAQRFGWKSILWTGWLGTPIHELSHVAMCVLFRHRIDDVALFEPDVQSGRLGYVRHSFTKANRFERVGNVFIGLAPLAGGALALATLLWMFYPNAVATAIAQQEAQRIKQSGNPPIFPVTNDRPAGVPAGIDFSTLDIADLNAPNPSAAKIAPVLTDSITQFWDATTTVTGCLFHQIFTPLNLKTKRFWCFVYLTLCVGSHMAPSRSDYAGARHGAVLLGAIVGGSVLLISVLGFDSISVSIWLLNFISPILAVMILAIVLCVVAALLVYVVTMLFPVRYQLR